MKSVDRSFRKRVAANIRRLRVASQRTQCGLAAVLRIHRNIVYQWEKAIAIPRLDSSLKLAKLFGVTVEELCR